VEQCTRLGHKCDYSPRFSFQDDTRRIVERMQEISAVGDFVWDRESSSHKTGMISPAAESSAGQSAAEDNLPPFAALTTDEEREQRAGKSSPGTFYVVVNSKSFSHLYNGHGLDNPTTPFAYPRQGSLAIAERSDPNVVILSRFENTTRGTSALKKGKATSALPVSPSSDPRPCMTGLSHTDGTLDEMQNRLLNAKAPDCREIQSLEMRIGCNENLSPTTDMLFQADPFFSWEGNSVYVGHWA
jgi:hypothetical protein